MRDKIRDKPQANVFSWTGEQAAVALCREGRTGIVLLPHVMVMTFIALKQAWLMPAARRAAQQA